MPKQLGRVGSGTMESEAGVGFFDLNTMPFVTKRQGVSVKSVPGDRILLQRVSLARGTSTSHEHPEEQAGYVLSGRVRITIGDDSAMCGPGEAYHIPSNAPHAFDVSPDEDLEYIEVFSPPKRQ